MGHFVEQLLLAIGVACLGIGWLFFAGSFYWSRHVLERYEDCMETAPWYVKLCEWVMGR